ncbi:MAG: hypothetical protein AUJ55_13265 [Proteobacteria bacterium CG1_02_64_396]|nr:MAG: hypothetical protein AUJ55_13265 [Proteobacteria bacterium CG1_02_64_396]
MSESATLVVTGTPNPNEMESIQGYLQGVMPLLLGAGGKLVKRLKVENVLHGTPSGMAMVMDFDSVEAITTMFASEQYTALIPMRDKGFSAMNILVTRNM